MARYTINLPGNIPGDVRQGKVFKKRASFIKHWPFIKLLADERTGYVVSSNGLQYHLLKTNAGQWPAAGEDDAMATAIKSAGKWQPVSDDQLTLAIKKAIDDYENKQ